MPFLNKTAVMRLGLLPSTHDPLTAYKYFRLSAFCDRSCLNERQVNSETTDISSFNDRVAWTEKYRTLYETANCLYYTFEDRSCMINEDVKVVLIVVREYERSVSGNELLRVFTISGFQDEIYIQPAPTLHSVLTTRLNNAVASVSDALSKYLAATERARNAELSGEAM
jgi:hypothetical protein